MNRTLRRPMFRMGGSTGTGITSGLDTPRQGYKEPGVVDKNDVIRQDAQRIFDVGVDLRKANQIPTNKMLYGSLPGFLTSFGLNLASQTPTGNIFSTAATAAKAPFEQFQQGRLMQQEKARARRDDALDAAVASAVDLERERIEAAGKKTGGTEFEKERRVQMLNSLYDSKILQKQVELENASGEARDKVLADIETLKREKEDYATSILSGSMTEDDFVKDIIIAGVKNDVFDPAKVAEKYPALAGLLYDEMADGGRAGYNVGGQAMMPAVAEAEEDQIENLSFTELRARLPQSIDNSIVQVIANSKQALLDFANIRDQQDVDEFNQRYNVSLNIAQEG
tara:strand:- start:201 stop:1217 length:1017 start_codon:yes stop_codon:yes gene_type:complete